MSEDLQGLLGKSITDIFLVGYADLSTNPTSVCLRKDIIYLKLKEELLVIKANIYQRKFEYAWVADFGYDFSFTIDEDDSYVYSSIWDLIGLDFAPDQSHIKKVVLYKDNGFNAALELVMTNDQMIFFDATYLEGFKLGSEFLKGQFFENVICNWEQIIIQ